MGKAKQSDKSIDLFWKLFVVVAIALIFVVWFLYNNNDALDKKLSQRGLKDNPYENLNIKADAVFVYDILNDKILFAKNEDRQIPLASVTKLMTALVAKEQSKKGQNLEITLHSIKPEGDSGLLVGEKWSIKNLTDLTLIASSNDGARALASVGALKYGATKPDRKSTRLNSSHTDITRMPSSA